MELNVKETIEHEDGSATLIIDMDEETKRYLINYAFNDILSAALSDVEKLHEKGIQVELGD